jgi:hypothetical protein
MIHIIEQQNLYLQTTKQIIFQNLNDSDKEINLEPDNDVDMEGFGTTIRGFLMKHLDNKGNALFHSMEHTDASDVYWATGTMRILITDFTATKKWASSAYIHVASNLTSEKKQFTGFVNNSIPPIIDASRLHQPPKCRQHNKVQHSYSDIAHWHGHPDNDSDATSPTAAETATQQTQTRQRTATRPGPQGSPTQQDGHERLPSEGAMSGLANMKLKLAEIYKEREKIINSQQKIKDDVSEMTDSFTKHEWWHGQLSKGSVGFERKRWPTNEIIE